ncbi:class I SAM-dependent methyltransferase [Planctomyces sp. SH-PL14]|uniref:class I SAM-dependent methyltransferase n=1 Tax=Planctomyces sp. SH-PL14 TaxID=1632864 RepID=UPI00078BDCFD|nr:SAM-dependent methyltransferase [Planctomyces sp. SH-PL14]AMV16871.1 hypothetical protein VT03_03205 [Planctomyces sp. SH-PL14]
MQSTDDLIRAFAAACEAGELVQAVLSDPFPGPSDRPRRLRVRPVVIRKQPVLQWTLQFDRSETHENLDRGESVGRLTRALESDYRQAVLTTTGAEVHYRRDRQGRVKLSEKARSRPQPDMAHDRQKAYLIPDGTPCPFLIDQGVMAPDGHVRAAMMHKFRQINRFLEFVEDVYADLPAEGTLLVQDYGCGKSYLTFAVHHLLSNVHGREVEILGLDHNPHVIETCCRTAERLGLDGLSFRTTRIADKEAEGKPLHLAVALHACDTATDDALIDAAGRTASVILAAPCCQHEVAARLAADAVPALTAHGILKERLAALATDALRAAALEAAGYRTQVLEFIETEHTPKNLLIRGVRRKAGGDGEGGIDTVWRTRYDDLKRSLGLGEASLRTDEILPPAAEEAARG